MRPEFRASIERLEGRDLAAAGLTTVLRTDRHVYAPGQAVVMTLTEKNTSTRDIRLGVGPSVDAFTVSQGGHEVWRSSGGIQALFVVEKTLHPGQSLTVAATWHGQTPESRPAHRYGPFTVQNTADTSARAVIRFAQPPADPLLNLRTHPLGGRISR